MVDHAKFELPPGAPRFNLPLNSPPALYVSLIATTRTPRWTASPSR